ncbi:hypothetical protein CNEO2_790002 [Clostridium neonatale]|nr:hypothetical protein CNEO2_790002 [Clostridium neonatale]
MKRNFRNKFIKEMVKIQFINEIKL